MKKTFSLKVSNKKVERQADSIKHEVKKYLSRERRKTTPEGVDFWDFDCKIGESSASCQSVGVAEIGKNIDKFVTAGLETFYVEILSKPGKKIPRNK
jgi:hypothetical protein